MYTLDKIIRRRKNAELTAYCFFLDVQKAYDIAWRIWVWKNMWEIEIRGKTWRMMKNITECARSAAMLEGEISKYLVV